MSKKISSTTLLTVDVNVVAHVWFYSGNGFAVVEGVDESAMVAEQVFAINVGLA